MSHYQTVADRLIQDGYLLTALELHTELEERGKSLKSLKEFFENSLNFEKFTRQTSTKKTPSPAESISSIAGSQFTDGSLFNMTRYSEDSHIHAEADKVAILEFELRRATQTINSLRTELTQQIKQYDPDKRRSIQKIRNESGGREALAEGKDPTDKLELCQSDEDTLESDLRLSSGKDKIPSDSDSSYDMLQQGTNNIDDDDEDEDSLELFGHEKRVLNYLVNEYLLQYGYKLTAITFSDENTDEDFEDWDSIGLNISKPPDLGRIYRNFNSRNSQLNAENSKLMKSKQIKTCDIDTQCDEYVSNEDTALKEIVLSNESEMEELKLKLEDALSKNQTLREINSKHDNFEDIERDLRKQIAQLKKERGNEMETPKSSFIDEQGQLIADNVDDEDAEAAVQESKSPSKGTLITNEDAEVSPFLEFMKKKCLPSLEFNKDNIEDNELSSVESFQEIIQLLSIQLPQIIPHVLLARRGTVLPLLLIAIEHHPSIEVRDNLLTILFNLTKKPDEEMRSVIVKGFVEIVARQNARNNATIVEAEILPQLWQQIEHKHLERRILVAETCAWLLPNIPSDIRDSLVFSMLLQLVQQDRENQVRQVALNSLGILILYLNDTDKLHNVIPNVLRPCLNDSSDDIVVTTQNGLLLCVAFRLAMADLNHLFQSIANELTKSCEMLEPVNQVDSNKQINQPTIHQGNNHSESSSNNAFSEGLNVVLLHKLKTCQYLLPFVISCVIKSSPFYEKQEMIQDLSDIPFCFDSNTNSDRQHGCMVNMDTILPLQFTSMKGAMNYVKLLQEYLSREWYEPWFELTWISDVLLVSMIQSASQIPVPGELGCDSYLKANFEKENFQINQDILILEYISFFRELCFMLGKDYSNKSIIPKFEEKLLTPSTSSDSSVSENIEASKNENKNINFTSALLPVYALGVLSNFQTASQLANTICKWCIKHCQEGLSTQPLVFTIHYILKLDRPKIQLQNEEWYSEIRDTLSEMAWTLLVHTSAKVRVFSGVILDILAAGDFTSTYDLVGTKILPGLVTLSSDSDYKVQKSAIPGLGSIIFAVSQGRRISNETCEKALFQLTSFLSEDTGPDEHKPSMNMKNIHEINMEVAETISSIVIKYNKNLNSKRRESNCSSDLSFMSIRDEVLIPKLNVISDKYVGTEYPDSKCLEMCNTLLNIYRTMILEVKLPPQVFQSCIGPSLGKLSKDFHRFGIVAQETVCLQLIAQLESDYGHINLPGTVNHNFSISNHTISSSPSMDEMKNKMGKLKGFWKK